jgi:hypothetical protein
MNIILRQTAVCLGGVRGGFSSETHDIHGRKTMPIQYFISPDSQNWASTQNPSRAMLASIDIVKRLYEEFNQQEHLHVIIVNPDKQELIPDFIAITEHGMGFMNLHHEPGTVSREGDVWCADGRPIASDTHLGCRNPHEQVQLYAGKIRDALMNVPQGTRSWLGGRYITWQDLIFDTAACFTHREASVEYFRKYYSQDMKQGKYAKKWERFSILEPDEISRWVSTLCFEANIEDIANVQSYRLTQNQIIRIAIELFSTTEWTAIDKLMQVSKPYGYLLIRQNGEVITFFALDREKMIIGRGESCDITIPHEFKFVSREHVKITHSDRGVAIEDCSRNGTFINGVLLETPIYLNPGQQFTLGGNKLVDGVCLLEFSLDPPTMSHT